MEWLSLSPLAYDRILKVSRTIVDLEDADDVLEAHINEVAQYRSLDREGFGWVMQFLRILKTLAKL